MSYSIIQNPASSLYRPNPYSPPDSPPSSSPIAHLQPKRGMLRGVFSGSRSSSVHDVSMTERERLNHMHTVHTTLLSPTHSSVVDAHLSAVHASGRRSRVLDVGTGTGVWAIEMANSHPFTDVTAIDNNWSNFSGGGSRNGNVDFLSVDVTRPLTFPTSHFDVIHVESLLLDVPHYTSLLERLAVILRPGGLLMVIESEPTYEDALGVGLSTDMRMWNRCFTDACQAKGIDVHLPSKLSAYIAASGILHVAPYSQQSTVTAGGAMSGGIKSLSRAGRLHPQLVAANLRAAIPAVLAHGYPAYEVNRVADSCWRELTDRHSHLYHRLHAIYAHKISY